MVILKSKVSAVTFVLSLLCFFFLFLPISINERSSMDIVWGIDEIDFSFPVTGSFNALSGECYEIHGAFSMPWSSSDWVRYDVSVDVKMSGVETFFLGEGLRLSEYSVKRIEGKTYKKGRLSSLVSNSKQILKVFISRSLLDDAVTVERIFITKSNGRYFSKLAFLCFFFLFVITFFIEFLCVNHVVRRVICVLFSLVSIVVLGRFYSLIFSRLCEISL